MDPITTTIAEVLLEQGLKRSLKIGWRKASWLPVTLVNKLDKVRVTCSAFLRVRDKRGRYLLIRNLHRPEFFGPVGGCYKYYDGGGTRKLNQFFYCPDSTSANSEAERDIRGFIRRATTAKFFEWFQSQTDRESARECLSREIREELVGECNLILPSNFDWNALSFRFSHSFLEKSVVSGTRNLQFRSFEVHDLDLDSKASRILFDKITNKKSARLLWANNMEIELGRCSNEKSVLGHAAVLFISDKISRPDLPSHAH